jgi:SAM-dependent methyltransferase
MSSKSLLLRGLYLARDFRSRALFGALARHVRGDVLDVGGWDFYLTAKRKGVACTSWTTLESDPTRLPEVDAPEFRAVHGDGQAMTFADASFDTVLSIQVLEHVLEPLRMVDEMARVLRPGGTAVLLIPQTSTMHLTPHYYGNFSRYWVRDALARAGLELVEHAPLGGIWSSMASHQFYFLLQLARVKGMSDPEIRRPALFPLFAPLQVLWALVSLPVCLFLSLADLAEEPNNHLVVARKPGAR